MCFSSLYIKKKTSLVIVVIINFCKNNRSLVNIIILGQWLTTFGVLTDRSILFVNNKFIGTVPVYNVFD